MTHNPNAPHKAIVFVRYEVHEMLPNGQCNPKIVGDRCSTLYSFTGLTYQEALDKAKTFIERLSNDESDKE